jgi:hypothetical protein
MSFELTPPLMKSTGCGRGSRARKAGQIMLVRGQGLSLEG